jgi:hypothetical protein
MRIWSIISRTETHIIIYQLQQAFVQTYHSIDPSKVGTVHRLQQVCFIAKHNVFN